MVAGIVGLVVLMGVPSVAVAQNAGEIAGGYQFMRDFALDENFPAGWFVSGAGNLSDNIALVGEVSGSQKSESFFDVTADADILAFLGGVRVGASAGPVIPFAQVLVGGARAKVTLRGFGERESSSETAFALQPGGGVDIPFAENVSARAMVDYRRIFFHDDSGANEVRVAVGIVVGFGGN